jgi:hypothetical protein
VCHDEVASAALLTAPAFGVVADHWTFCSDSFLHVGNAGDTLASDRVALDRVVLLGLLRLLAS